MKTTLASISCLILLSTAAAAAAQGTQAGSTTRPPAVTSPAPVGTSGSATSLAADYKLVAGDKLRIDVYKDQQLSQPQLQIRPDGKITVPLLGDLPAAGKTALQLRDEIAAALKAGEYHANPVVTVIVTETVPPTISVMGEVKSPGPQPLHGQMSVIEALAAAGGFTDWANEKNIKILRKGPTGTTTIKFNYKDAINSYGKPMMLQAGDVIIVP
jgi:polysaccharide export outer membrane protein